ncbi:VCBS repeat-containing protein [Flavihumibacter sediminis]|nr:VCBS repeat-containing protein [Flavihumibacter sediminis]
MKPFNAYCRVLFICLIFFFIGCKNDADNISPEKGNSMFVLLSPDVTGINFQNTLTEALNTNILMYEYFYNGGGVAVGDFNNDGLEDIYFSSNMAENKMYLNKGNLKFVDITLASHAGGRPGPWKTGVNAVDINADGRLDIYLCYSGALPPEKRANQLFINVGNDSNGIPLFEERAESFGLASTGFSNQSYFFDYDKDGDLDMLLLNHNPKNLPLLNEAGTTQLLKQDNPEKGLRLFRQDNGLFTDVTKVTGINGSELSYGLGLGISDLDGDSWPDFYVSNDYSVPDYLYINNKNGTFTNKLQSSLGHTSQFSMGNDIADINNDQLPDIYTLDMLPEDNHRQKLLLSPDNYEKFNLNLRSGFYYQYMRNMLHLNNGNGSFSETAQAAGISNTDWSWAALLADYDNDGWKDLYVTNGYLRDYTNLDFINYMNEYVQQKGRLQREDVMQIIQQMPSSNVANYIFKNREGNAFENKSNEWINSKPSNSNGAVYSDLDNDGDLELIVNNINEPAFIYKNESRSNVENQYLQFTLKGNAPNLQGIGAKLIVFHQGLSQVVEQYPARGYLSSVSSMLHFGLGKARKADSVIITWNSGMVQKLYDVKAGQRIIIEEKDASKLNNPAEKVVPWFTETPSPIRYQSFDNHINDFNRQPLLISQFSYMGPCMVTHDLNGDGKDDVLVGGEAGAATSLWIQSPGGSFIQKRIPAFERDNGFVDSDIAVLDANSDGHMDIFIASGGYHSLTSTDSLLQDRLYLNDGKSNFIRSSGLPILTGSKSCVRVHDINEDGYPDIFVGGRVVPGRYPENPSSYILINNGKGFFTDETSKICPALSTIGMVTDAAWFDFDLDKKKELLLVGEWMPITVFKLEGSKMVKRSEQFFDKSYSGFWNRINIGDLNADGRPDLVLGNMGNNTQFNASEKEPLEMFYSDFDKNGSVDPVFSYYIQHRRYPYLTRDELIGQLPVMRKRFASYKSYADITLEELFDNETLAKAGKHTAYHMMTSLFLGSTGGKFQLAQLPKEVQYSPVYTINQLDYNNDGLTDLLLCGNNSRTKIRLGKFDANYGLLLKGDGKGNFKYVKQRESGFNIKGDVRSCVQVGNRFYLGINGREVASYKLMK